LGYSSAGGFVAVYEHMSGRDHKPAESHTHRSQGRLQDIDLINDFVGDDSYTDIQSLALDQAVGFFSLRHRKKFAVTKIRNSIRGRENNGGGNNGTGEGASTGFIHAGDQAVAPDESEVK
jgi:hypothetical protein